MAIAEQDKPKRRMGTKLEKFIDGLGEILGFLTICLIAFLYIEAQFNLLAGKAELLGGLWILREIAIIIVVGLKGMEIILKGNSFILFLIYAAIFALVIIFAFFPDTGFALVKQIRNL